MLVRADGSPPPRHRQLSNLAALSQLSAVGYCGNGVFGMSACWQDANVGKWRISEG